VALDADLVFVHLTTLDQAEGQVELADSATSFEAIDFVRRVAGARPWVADLSMDQAGDPHHRATLVEQGMDAVLSERPGRASVQGTDNYWDTRLHSTGHAHPSECMGLSWQIVPGGPNEEILYPGRNAIEGALQGLDGTLAGYGVPGERAVPAVNATPIGSLFHRLHEPNSFDNHVSVSLDGDIPVGNWTLLLTANDVIDGRYHIGIQRDEAEEADQSSSGLADAHPSFTTGSSCNGLRTTAFGASDTHSPNRQLAHFSSAGPTRDGRVKPDLVAPGVAVLSAR